MGRKTLVARLLGRQAERNERRCAVPELACDDLNEEPCDFVAEGETANVAVESMVAHLEGSHDWNVGELSIEENKQLVEPWNKYIAVR